MPRNPLLEMVVKPTRQLPPTAEPSDGFTVKVTGPPDPVAVNWRQALRSCLAVVSSSEGTGSVKDSTSMLKVSLPVGMA